MKMASNEWTSSMDCDHCGWGLDAPPEFDLPPPPLPPFMQPPPEYCRNLDESLETCQAFLVEDAEYQVPLDSPPSLAAIVVSAAILTVVVILVATLLLWRYRKQREEQKVVVRCQQKNGGGGTVPANLLQGIAPTRSAGINLDDVDGVFYDELISYPTHYRTPQPPAYEMKDVFLKSSPCHCTAHPLLGSRPGTVGRANGHHYVTSPYHSSSNCSSSTPTTSNADDRADSGSWIAEPVYEELPSGPEEDFRSPRDQRRGIQHCYGNGSASVNQGSLLRNHQRGGTSMRRNTSFNNQQQHWPETGEPAETDLFLAPTTWYQQHNSPRGQLTTQGPVRPGRGGIRAAWRELETDKLKRRIEKTSVCSSRMSPAPEDPLPQLHYQTGELYRGKCPPEDPPVANLDDSDDPLDPLRDQSSPEQPPSTTTTTTTNGKATLPRYYYYSESDDYGVNGTPVQRTLSSTTGRRGIQPQRHLNSRTQRTLQHRSPTSDVIS